MRRRFGDFFFRVVVMEYLEDQQEKSTLVSLSVLLDRNPYNLIDVDNVFKECADRGFFLRWPFSDSDFIVAGRFSPYRICPHCFWSLFNCYSPLLKNVSLHL